MRATPPRDLVGREDELDGVLGLLDDPDRLPGTVVIRGEAGIGKTELLLSGRAAAVDRGFRVLSTRSSEAEASYAYAGLTDLLGAVVPEVLPHLPPIQRRALETALLLGESEDAVDERAIGAAFLGALRALARDAPVAVAIDDLQWLDPGTLTAFRFALPRLETDRVASLLAARGEIPDWLRRSVREERLSVVELEGLSLGAVHELLRTRFEHPLRRPVVVLVHETSAGNPFYALELARALERRGGQLDRHGALPLPPTLEDLVDERLAALPASGARVATIVALAGSPAVEVVEAAAGAEADDGLAACIAGRVLEWDGAAVRVVHPLVASALRSRVDPREARVHHARLAELAPTAGARARHRALATTEPDESVATALDVESLAAHARGAFATAADLAEHALRLTSPEDDEATRRRLVALAGRLYDDRDDARAIALLEEACAALPPGVERARLLTRLAPMRGDSETPYEAVELYRAALADAAGDPALETEIHLNLADLSRFTSDRDQGLESARAALGSSSQIDDGALRCRALATYCLLHFSLGLGSADPELEEALRLERDLGFAAVGEAGTGILIHQLVWSGQLDAARPPLEAQRERLRSRDAIDECDSLWYLTLLEWRAGNWALAASHAERMLALRDQAGRQGLWTVIEFPSAIVACHSGPVDEARGRVERALAVAESADITISRPSYLWLLGFLELSLGDAEKAVHHLRPSWEGRDAGKLFEPGQRVELADTLEALVAVGALDEAESKIAACRHACTALDRARELAILHRARGLVQAARGDHDGAFACFDEALADHARAADPFEHARTLLALGATRRRTKQRGAARATLEDALVRFERLPAPLWADKARAELARIGGRPPASGELTESEQRIAMLVAQGRTNREVAAALFLTVHTVETALTRIYRKLGIRSRAELASRYATKT